MCASPGRGGSMGCGRFFRTSRCSLPVSRVANGRTARARMVVAVPRRSTIPRTHNNTSPRIAARSRSYTESGTTTLPRPDSSLTAMKVVPFAVGGRW